MNTPPVTNHPENSPTAQTSTDLMNLHEASKYLDERLLPGVDVSLTRLPVSKSELDRTIRFANARRTEWLREQGVAGSRNGTAA